MGYVTGEVSAADVAAIDGMLAAAARSLGSDDPRTEQQRRADMFADLLLGRLRLVDPDESDSDNALEEQADEADSVQSEWLEVEDVDPETGEFLGTRLQRIAADGEPIGEPIGPALDLAAGLMPAFIRRPRQLRIGVVVPLSSLLGLSDAPAELADRSGLISGEILRLRIAELVALRVQDVDFLRRAVRSEWQLSPDRKPPDSTHNTKITTDVGVAERGRRVPLRQGQKVRRESLADVAG